MLFTSETFSILNMHRAVNILISYLIKTYFYNNPCTVFITDESINIKNIQRISISTEEVENYNLKNHCNSFLINTNTSYVFEKLEHKIKNDGISGYGYRKYLIVLKEDEMPDFLTSKYLSYFIDLLFVRATFSKNCSKLQFFNEDEVVLNLYTYDFDEILKSNQLVLLDEWFAVNQSFKYGNDLFKNKNNGKVLKAATFTYSPYTIPGLSIGSELRLIKEFSKNQNRSLELIVNDAEEWGNVFENNTGVGVFGAVLDKAEIGFSAIFLWSSKYKYFDFSHTFIRSGVTCLLPAPKIFIGWTALLPYYSFVLQICIITTFLLASLVLFLYRLLGSFKYKRSYSNVSIPSLLLDSSFDITKIFLSEEAPTDKKYPIKTFLWLLIWLEMVLCIIFSGKLSSTLIVPSYTGSVNTVEELASSDYEWCGTQYGAWIDSIIDDLTPTYRKVINKFIEVKATNMSLGPHLGFAVERLPSGYFAIGKYIKIKWLKSLKIMKKDLYYAMCPIILRKNSNLLEPLNKFILEAQQAGLNIYWESEAVIHFEKMSKQNALKFYSDSRTEKGLTLTHFRGVFIIWSFGCLISLIRFIYEYNEFSLKNVFKKY